MTIEIRPSESHENCYNLYVNDHIAVSNESMEVCDDIKYSLEHNYYPIPYSEGAEIADIIRKYFTNIT